MSGQPPEEAGAVVLSPFKKASRRLFVGGALATLGAAGAEAASDHRASPALFDTHVHLTSADTLRYPLTADVQAGLRVRLPDNPDRSPSPNHWAEYERLPLAQRVVRYPNPVEEQLRLWHVTGVMGGVAVQYRSAYGTDNSYLLACAFRFPREICPVVVLDAEHADASSQLHALAGRQLVAGVRLSGLSDSGQRDWLESDRARSLWATAAALRMVVVVLPLPAAPHADVLKAISILAGTFPGVSVVIDHSGWFRTIPTSGTDLDESFRAMASRPNLFLKFTNVNLNLLAQERVDPTILLRTMVDRFGPDRIMWGTAYGSTSGPYATLVDQIVSATARLSPIERAGVLSGTGRRIFGRQG